MIIMVAYNGRKLTQECVQSIKSNFHTALLIDNGSTDGTWHYLQTVQSAVGIYCLPLHRVSLAKAWNFGLWFAFHQKKCTHALVVNNDTILAPLTHDALKGQFIDKEVGIISAVSVRSRSKLKLEIDPEELAKSQRPHPDFSCFMISRECYYSVGPFDERFEGAYCEDNDYHVRMHKSGWKAVCVDWPFVHVGAGTIKNADSKERERIERMAEMNRRRFWEKWGCWPGSKEYERIFK